MLDLSRYPPRKTDIIQKLQAVIAGSLSREAVAMWANQWVLLPDPPDMNTQVWEALITLSGADLKVAPAIYLHQADDLQIWLQEAETINSDDE